MNGIEMF